MERLKRDSLAFPMLKDHRYLGSWLIYFAVQGRAQGMEDIFQIDPTFTPDASKIQTLLSFSTPEFVDVWCHDPLLVSRQGFHSRTQLLRIVPFKSFSTSTHSPRPLCAYLRNSCVKYH